MLLPVLLDNVAGELDAISGQIAAFINRRTGELYTMITDEFMIDDEDDEARKKREEIEDSDDWVALPSKWDLNEYRIMEDFAAGLKNKRLQADLLDTIGGRGTFRRFKNMIDRAGLLDDWYKFKHEAFREFAADFLKSEEIPFTR